MELDNERIAPQGMFAAIVGLTPYIYFTGGLGVGLSYIPPAEAAANYYGKIRNIADVPALTLTNQPRRKPGRFILRFCGGFHTVWVESRH
ncbi:hypothetical protein DBB29_18475 [Pandoraea cepalis]|uniref:Uncharacterized protein n=1 Tax=Pandoraea cepalis TaxID=2508294 RepID=A0AAW7MP65_9BURK|nr:hypothetical protein [Pandoraea cepalis]MDN4580096.1 hypothetical protein [Pandoraea cepalis]